MNRVLNNTGLLFAEGNSTLSGSAWFLAPRLAITAAHVVGDRRKQALHSVSWWIQLEKTRLRVHAVRPAWDIDSALLVLVDEQPGRPSPAKLQQLASESDGLNWQSAGFPSAAIDRKRIEFHGDVVSRDLWRPDFQEIQLYCKEAGDYQLEKMGIDGISGAPVVVGDSVVGIITSLEDFGQGRIIWATPIEYLARIFPEVMWVLHPLACPDNFERGPDPMAWSHISEQNLFDVSAPQTTQPLSGILTTRDDTRPLLLFTQYPPDVEVLASQVAVTVRGGLPSRWYVVKDVRYGRLVKLMQMNLERRKHLLSICIGQRQLILEAFYKSSFPEDQLLENWDAFERSLTEPTVFLLSLDMESPQTLLRSCRQHGILESDASIAAILSDFVEWATANQHRVIVVAPQLSRVCRHIRELAEGVFHTWQCCHFGTEAVSGVSGEALPDPLRRLALFQSPSLRSAIIEFWDRRKGPGAPSIDLLIPRLLADGYWEAAYRLELNTPIPNGRELYRTPADVRTSGQPSPYFADPADVVGYLDDVVDVPLGIEGRWVLTGGPGTGKTTALQRIAREWALPREGQQQCWLPIILHFRSSPASIRSSLKFGASSDRPLTGTAHAFLADVSSHEELRWLLSSPVLVLADPPGDFALDAWQCLDEVISVLNAAVLVTASDALDVPLTWDREIILRTIEFEAGTEDSFSVSGRRSIEFLLNDPSLPASRCLPSPFLVRILTNGDFAESDLRTATLWTILEAHVKSCLKRAPDKQAEFARAVRFLGPFAALGSSLVAGEVIRFKKLGLLAAESEAPRFDSSLVRAFFAANHVLAEFRNNRATASQLLDSIPSYLRLTVEQLVFCELGINERIDFSSLLQFGSQKQLNLYDMVGALTEALPRLQELTGEVMTKIEAKAIGTSGDSIEARSEWRREVTGLSRSLGRFDPRISKVPRESDFVAVRGEALRLGRFPIVNSQFVQFVLEGCYREERWWPADVFQWFAVARIKRPRFWPDEAFSSFNAPVVGVSLYEALAYCAWLNARHPIGNLEFCIPPQRVWIRALGLLSADLLSLLKAADDNRTIDLPKWESTIASWRAALAEPGPYPIGTWPLSESGFGDLWGNVWEWTLDDVRSSDGLQTTPYYKRIVTVVGGPAGKHYQEFATLLGSKMIAIQRASNVGFRLALRISAKTGE
jgi:formylglycine-generating enzyme required for sulfatase activity